MLGVNRVGVCPSWSVTDHFSRLHAAPGVQPDGFDQRYGAGAGRRGGGGADCPRHQGSRVGNGHLPSRGGDPYAAFNGHGAVYKDNVQSYSTNEPAIDLTAASPLAFAWLAASVA